MAYNVTYKKKYLIIYKAYLKNLINANLWIVVKHNLKKQKTEIQEFVLIIEIK